MSLYVEDHSFTERGHMLFNAKIEKALRHVAKHFPAVTHVFFNKDGNWYFCDENFEAPSFLNLPGLDLTILEAAADAAYLESGFPCAYRRAELEDYYSLWDLLSDVPVTEGHSEFEDGSIEAEFCHFPPGTPREQIWRWFEEQHPRFIVGDVQQGIRVTAA